MQTSYEPFQVRSAFGLGYSSQTSLIIAFDQAGKTGQGRWTVIEGVAVVMEMRYRGLSKSDAFRTHMMATLNNKPVFWRDPAMPQLELRMIEDGRSVHYGSHSHREWSIGAITRGRSTYINGMRRHTVDAGTLVMMNPDEMHACNPIDGQPWAYYMLYIDADWLSRLRVDLGLLSEPHWQDLHRDTLKEATLFAAFVELCDHLVSADADLLSRQDTLITVLSQILPRLSAPPTGVTPSVDLPPQRLQVVADHLDAYFSQNVSLEQLCELAHCSQGHLIRAFRKHFGFTPHAYRVNRRIQYTQWALRQGASIAEAALAAGFADQAHCQRAFKKHLAATPNQYRMAGVAKR